MSQNLAETEGGLTETKACKCVAAFSQEVSGCSRLFNWGNINILKRSDSLLTSCYFHLSILGIAITKRRGYAELKMACV